MRRSRGFNLVEVVVALGLVMMAGVGGVAVFAVAMNSQTASRTTTDATRIAQAELQNMRLGDATRVALNQSDYDDMLANDPARVAWEPGLNGDIPLVRSNGTLTPHETTGENDHYTISRYVSCDTESTTCVDAGEPLTRMVRLVVTGPKNARVEIAGRIGNANVGASPAVDGPPATPNNLTVMQVADGALDVDWEPSESAATYRVTQDGNQVGAPSESRFIISNAAMEGAGAARETTVCVRALNIARAQSPQACLTIMLRPASVTAVRAGGDVTLNWASAPKAASIAGYQVERKVSYTELVKASNPIAYWRLNEPAGAAVAADSSGNGNTLRYVNDATPGVPGLLSTDDATAVRFGATSMARRATPLREYSLLGSTVEMWVKIEALPGRGQFIKIGHDGSTGVGVGYGGGASGTFDNMGTELAVLYEGVRWLPTGWHFPGVGVYHIVVRLHASGTAEVVVNGAAVAVLAGYTPRAPVGAVGLGGNHVQTGYPGRNFASGGVLDEVAIYNYILGEADIVKHYLAGIEGADWSATGPMAHWKFQTPGTSVPDLTGNAHTATMVGSPPLVAATQPPFQGQSVRSINNTQSVNLVKSPDLRNRNFSVAMWIRPTVRTGCLMEAISQYVAGQVVHLCWSNEGDGRLRAGFAHAGKEVFTSAGSPVSANEWHLVVLTYHRQAGNRMRIFVDGAIAGELADVGTTAGPNPTTMRFNVYNGGYRSSAQWADVAVFSNALNAQRVKDMYDSDIERLWVDGWKRVSPSAPLTGGSFTHAGGRCGDLYRIRAYKNAPSAAAVEGVDVATSSAVAAC